MSLAGGYAGGIADRLDRQDDRTAAAIAEMAELKRRQDRLAQRIADLLDDELLRRRFRSG